ncbi:hypothetical protein DF220_10770 [Salinibacterium hongtaonis]|uniref:DUF4352 domain-containing protein n=2 Tax=Homoserinimonas hongtaonis TaxID=2079791 RepID=A0A2U1T2Z0_9MICO|nr:hypothetical protein DF220_10770 [Salinibacterium hongtaonis]
MHWRYYPMPELSSFARVARTTAVVVTALTLAVGLSACGGGEEPAAPTSTTESGVGKSFESTDGVAVAVTRRICGISAVGKDQPEYTAVGQYCTVGVNVVNDSDASADLSQLKVTGHSGDTEYFPDYWAGTAADGGMQVLEPGGSVESTLFFDIPKGALLDTVTLVSPWPGIEEFEVAF